MTRALDRWLDARTSPALRDAWQELGAERLTLAPPGSFLTGHAAAQLAHDLLGFSRDSLAWLTTHGYDDTELDKAHAPPAWHVTRDTPSCFLDAALDMNESCNEAWSLRELVHGDRGVQHLTVGWSINDGSRDGLGTGATVIRIFDRAAELAVSVFSSSGTAAVISPPTERSAFIARVTASLDLFERMQTYRIDDWRRPDTDRLRVLLAEIAARVEPAFASSATWPSSVTDSRGLGPPDDRHSLIVATASQPPFAVEIEDRHWQNAWSTTVTAQGLPWGWKLVVVADVYDKGANIRVESRLPRALGDLVHSQLPVS